MQIRAQRPLLEGSALLARLQQEFSAWQAQEEAGAGWGFSDVLAAWRRRGLVEYEVGLDRYHFDAAKW